MGVDKPFLTYEEQLKKIKNDYNIKDCDDKKLEIDILKIYDLANGYKELHNNMSENITLLDLYQFIIFDKKFQNILSLFSIYVENSFKTKLAYLISYTRGLETIEYLDIKKYFANSKRKQKLVSTIEDLKSIELKSTDNPTKFYRESHNHRPAWILFKNTYFNTVIDLFTFLSKEEKLLIINEYDFLDNSNLTDEEKIELFKNMITIVRKFRNKIVHNNKIINVTLEKNQIIYKNFKKIDNYSMIKRKDIIKKRGTNDIYSMFVSLLYLLNNDMLRRELCEGLETLLTNNLLQSKKYLLAYNYPSNLLDRIQQLNF